MHPELRNRRGKLLAQEADRKVYNIVHLIYPLEELRGPVQGLRVLPPHHGRALEAGYNDAIRTLRHPEVAAAADGQRGVFTFDLKTSTAANSDGPTSSVAGSAMKLADVRKRASPCRSTSPAYPPGPYRFYNREFMVITYRTDPEMLRAVVPEPLEVIGDTRQVRVHPHAGSDRLRRLHRDRPGDPGPLHRAARSRKAATHAMYLDDNSPIAGGREIWGFPKKLAHAEGAPRDRHAGRHARTTARCACVTATMGYKHKRRSRRGARGAGQARTS